jgi:dihydroorotase
MSILIKSARILSNGSPYDNKKLDILVSESGVIKSIGKDVASDNNRVIEGKNLMVSIGWFDMRANFNDPGNEHKEDLNSGLKAAAAGGFTGISLLPNTNPCVESKNEVSYLRAQNSKSITQVYPMGAVTKGCKGEDFTEILDMNAAGAVAFTDGENPIWNTDILLKTLQYLQKFNGLLINRPEDTHLTAFGTMNEGVTSTYLGMKGMPGIAEELMVRRDIELLKYAGGRIHFANLSTAKSVKLVAAARKSGLDVTCDVAIPNLIFEDTTLESYDTNYKVNPPLRSRQDIKALEKAITADDIDVIVSAHSPQDEESKKLEFDHADFGMISLQTFLPMILMKSESIALAGAIEKFTVNPRKILGIPIPLIREGEKANLTIFDPAKKWVYNRATNFSKAINSPLYNTELTGSVIGVLNNGRSFFNSY